MENLIRQTVRRYGWFFLASVVAIIALGALCYFDIIPSLNVFAERLNHSLQSVIMMVILILIPTTLSIFRRKSLKWKKLEEPAARVLAYGKGIMVRLIVFDCLSLLSILMHIFISKNNAMTLLMMTGVFFLFILPNKMQLCRDLDLNPDGSIFVPEQPVPAAEVSDTAQASAADDDDDFIPRNHKREGEDAFDL